MTSRARTAFPEPISQKGCIETLARQGSLGGSKRRVIRIKESA